MVRSGLGADADLRSLTPVSRGDGIRSPRTGLPFLPVLQQQHQVLARERDPLVLQLDTFGETIGRIPMSRGKRLHAL